MDPEEVGDNDDLAHLHEIEDHLAIFCMATYGEGDPTDNAHDLKVWLSVFVRDGINSVAYYNSTWMGVVVIVVVYFFTMG